MRLEELARLAVLAVAQHAEQGAGAEPAGGVELADAPAAARRRGEPPRADGVPLFAVPRLLLQVRVAQCGRVQRHDRHESVDSAHHGVHRRLGDALAAGDEQVAESEQVLLQRRCVAFGEDATDAAVQHHPHEPLRGGAEQRVDHLVARAC